MPLITPEGRCNHPKLTKMIGVATYNPCSSIRIIIEAA
jgi:hypothetical protein